MATLALGDWETAERLFREIPRLLDPGGASDGALHLMAKRNDVEAVQWLLDHHADPNARWSHWDADVTPLHLAVLGGHTDIVRRLLPAREDRGGSGTITGRPARAFRGAARLHRG